MVDLVRGPGGVVDFGNGVTDGWFEGPKFAPFFEIDSGVGALDLPIARVWSAYGNPCFEVVDFRFRKSGFGRHFEISIGVGDGLDEEGLAGVSGNDGGSGIAAGFPAGPGVEVEVGLQFFGLSGVALITMVDKERADVAFEVFEPCGLVCE